MFVCICVVSDDCPANERHRLSAKGACGRKTAQTYRIIDVVSPPTQHTTAAAAAPPQPSPYNAHIDTLIKGGRCDECTYTYSRYMWSVVHMCMECICVLRVQAYLEQGLCPRTHAILFQPAHPFSADCALRCTAHANE